MSVIEFEGVSFRYNAHWVVEEVNLKIEEREFICVVGPNGGGKSTFLKIILGLITPQKGQVKVLGMSPFEARRWIGYMPQFINFDPRFPITVLDIVQMGTLSLGKKVLKEESLYLLEELGMRELANQPFWALSGGQRQRTLIARALVGQPKILIFDEPTANMDVEVSQKLIELMKTLNQRMTILMVSHDYRFVESVVSHVICVNKNVAVHGTEAITIDRIQDTFHGHVRLIQHNHCEDSTVESETCKGHHHE